LSTPQGLRITKHCARSARGKLRPQKGQIGVGIISEYLGLGFTGFGESKPHASSAADDVTVGQDKAIPGDHHTGTGPAPPSSFGNAFDPDDRRTDPLDHGAYGPRIGVEWILVWRVTRLAGKFEH
jgi:hypothetical protein